ncbi:hypothetical protein NX059_000975 [Plenodomus lindquistii]|nr:hypothetical protein NX059_000975 [Plenodomus lindquistii]
MSIRKMFGLRSARRASDNTTGPQNNNEPRYNTSSTTSIESTGHARGASSRLRNGLRKVFDLSKSHRHDTAQSSAIASSGDAPTSSTAKSQSRTSSPLACTSSSAAHNTSSNSPTSTPPSTAVSAVADTCLSSAHSINLPVVAPPSATTAAAPTVLKTCPSTSQHVQDDATSAARAGELSEQEVAMAAFERANAILEARHAALNPKPVDGSKPSKAVVKVNKAHQHKATTTVAKNPSHPHFSRVKPTFATAADAATAMQRRQHVMGLVYESVFYGYADSQDKLHQLNDHFHKRSVGLKGLDSDIIIGFGDFHFRASELGNLEHKWLARYNTICLLQDRHDARVLGGEDYEYLKEQLIPGDDGNQLTPAYFEIFLESLKEEGVLTDSEFLSIRDLGVTQDELEAGFRYIAPHIPARDLARQAQNLRLFRMPERHIVGSLAQDYTPADSLQSYLRTLVEAAVYKQKFYQGFFFGDAAKDLGNYLKAHQQAQQNELHASNDYYFRAWTFQESRILDRGRLLCQLFKQYEEGAITDFGVLRIIRATLVHVPGQPRFFTESLEQLLYNRASSSNLPIAMIPEILALLPEHDNAFACPVQREEILGKLNATAQAFEVEETERLATIEANSKAYKQIVKQNLGIWGRVKRKAKTVFGRKKKGGEGKAFNPFDPVHGSCVPADKDDGSFY